MGDFQVGVGANEKNGNFGAAGWVNYEHTTLSGTIGDRDVHRAASDFLMDLTLIPEPTTGLLVGAGLIAMAGLRRRVEWSGRQAAVNAPRSNGTGGILSVRLPLPPSSATLGPSRE